MRSEKWRRLLSAFGYTELIHVDVKPAMVRLARNGFTARLFGEERLDAGNRNGVWRGRYLPALSSTAKKLMRVNRSSIQIFSSILWRREILDLRCPDRYLSLPRCFSERIQ